MKASQFGVIALVLSGLISFTANAADAEAGKTKSAVCAGCHGVDGNSSSPLWPSLAGQHASYINKQLMDFKEGRRINAQMTGMVAGLSPEDMQDLAAFYESQRAKPVTFNTELIEKGENIYRGGIADIGVAACIACHSPGGTGNGPAGWPSIKGQHPEYIVAQLQAFKQGLRANDNGRMMRNLVARMSEAEMQAVAAYVAGIQ
jgi:cytochrome c553